MTRNKLLPNLSFAKRFTRLVGTFALCFTAITAFGGNDTSDTEDLTPTPDACINYMDGVPCPCPECGGSGGPGGSGGSGGSSADTDDPVVIPDLMGSAAGNPIDMIKKSKVAQYTDAEIPLAGGLKFAVQRVYTSGRLALTTIDPYGSASGKHPLMGNSWHSPFDARVLKEAGNNHIVVVMPDSRPRGCLWEPSRLAWLSRKEQGYLVEVKYNDYHEEYTVTFPSRAMLKFNKRGYLTSSINSSGSELRFERELIDDSGTTVDRLKIVHAPESDGRRFEFDYGLGAGTKLRSITLKTNADANYSKQLAYYSYAPSGEQAGLLVESNSMGQAHGDYYRYGSWDPSANGGQGGTVMIDNRPWMRTLAEIGKRSASSSFVRTHAYSYRSGGFDNQQMGWMTVEPWKEFKKTPSKALYGSSGEMAQTYTVSADYDDEDYASGESYYTRIYRGTASPGIVPYSVHQGEAAWRYTDNIANSTGFSAFNIEYDWDGQRAQPARVYSGGNISKESSYPTEYSLGSHLSWNNPTEVRSHFPSGSSYAQHYTNFQYDTFWNKPTWTKDPYGRVASFQYDEDHGQVTQAISPSGAATNYVYNDDGRLTDVSNSVDGDTSYQYFSSGYSGVYNSSGAGLLAKVAAPNGLQKKFSYDHLSRLSRTEYNDGTFSEYIYDSNDQLTTVTDGHTTSTIGYDEYGRRSSIAFSPGRMKYYGYDDLDRLTVTTGTAGGGSRYVYDDYDNLVAFIDENDRVTSYTYDDAGRLSTVKDVDGNTRTYEYGSDGCQSCSGSSLKKIMDPNGNVITIDYDTYGRMEFVKYYAPGQYPGTPTRVLQTRHNFTVQRDAQTVPSDLVTSVVDSTAAYGDGITHFDYDTTMRLQRVRYSDGNYIEFYYDNEDRVAARRDVDGNILEYAYDGNDLLTTITDIGGRTTVYSYNSLSDPGPLLAQKEVRYFNGTRDRAIFDSSTGQLQRIESIDPALNVLASLDYSYDEHDNITTVGLEDDSAIVYTYDAAKRLTGEKKLDSGGNLRWERAYVYNSTGNRTTHSWFDGITSSTSTYAVNALNQITAVSGEAQPEMSNIGYDDNGNLLEYTADDGFHVFEWTLDDRLKSVTVDGNLKAEFVYDYTGLRALKRGPDGVRTRYYYNGNTEEITKQSVTDSYPDYACMMTARLDGTLVTSEWAIPNNNVSQVYDAERRSDVIKILGNTYAMHGKDWRGGGANYDYNITGDRVISMWFKSSGDCELVVTVQSSGGWRGLRYGMWGSPSATPSTVSGNLAIFFSSLLADGNWRRLERNLAQDVAAAWPGETLIKVMGITVAPYTANHMYIDDVRFCDAMTVERNSIGNGDVAQIVAQTSTHPSTYAITEMALHYNLVGTIEAVSDASGALLYDWKQDAWGNQISNGTTGQWSLDASGYHHNTKFTDADVALIYMHNRWYNSVCASFMSQAPYGQELEHPYSFATQNPITIIDPTGEVMVCCGKAAHPKLSKCRKKHCWVLPDDNPDDPWGMGGDCKTTVLEHGPGTHANEDPRCTDGRCPPGAGEKIKDCFENLDKTKRKRWVPFANDCVAWVNRCLREAGCSARASRSRGAR